MNHSIKKTAFSGFLAWPENPVFMDDGLLGNFKGSIFVCQHVSIGAELFSDRTF